MVYAPKLQEATESLIFNNVLAILARDVKPALDYFYASDDLPDFVERTLGSYLRRTYPCMALDPEKTIGSLADDGSFSEALITANIYLAVSDADPNGCTDKLLKYLRVVKSVLKNATTADYISGVPANTVGGLVVEVSHQFGEIAKNPNKPNEDPAGFEWMRPAVMELSFKFNER